MDSETSLPAGAAPAALAGKTALVTGAGRGIGRAIASGLAAAGARLVLVARSADQLAETAKELTAGGAAEPLIIPADLGDDGQLSAAVAAAQAGGGVDILINNAAVVEPLGPTAGLDRAEVRRAFEVNVVAVIALSGALLPAMVTAGWGRIVNVSSGIASRPASMIGGGTYAATKAALEAHTVNLAAELAGTGVTVNAYQPGGVDTAMQSWIRGQDPDRIGAGLHQQFNASHASGRLITPEHTAASLLARLVTDVTGQVWSVRDPLPGQ
jgi:NAD(P)-dependent dehydrogenase (short-subunit alcohol dehydrogenase family)